MNNEAKILIKETQMAGIITTSLAISGLFVVCYPVAMIVLNVILSKMEAKAV